MFSRLDEVPGCRDWRGDLHVHVAQRREQGRVFPFSNTLKHDGQHTDHASANGRGGKRIFFFWYIQIAYYAEFAIARWVKRSMLTHCKRFVEVVARRGERCDFTSDATGDGDASTTQIKAR